ncbi:MAG TPA: hypothetical protein DCY13_17925 [Verrucomicrobiales bacterium]|nr:hypothetical protein [Verrucomicrobiales bacterium]
MNMKFHRDRLNAWMLALLLAGVQLPLFAQDTDQQDRVTEADSPAQAPSEAAESTDPAGDASAGEANRGERVWRSRHANPFVGIFTDIEVGSNELAEVVVTIASEYVVNGRVADNAVTVLGKGKVNGPVVGKCVTIMGDVEVRAPVDENVVVVASTAYIDAVVDGDVILVASKAEFGPNARVRGETIIVGPSPKIDGDAVFDGPKSVFYLPDLSWIGEYVRFGPMLLRPIAPGVIWVWWIVLFFFLFRLILLLLLPRPIKAGAEVMRQGALRTFLIGIIAYILYLPALGLLGATVVGGIAVPFVAIAWEIATLLGKISVLVLLGNHLGRQMNNTTLQSPVGGFIAGTVLVTLIYLIPVLGMIVHLLIKPLALGCMLVAAVDAFQRERRPPTLRPTSAEGAPAATLHANPPAPSGNDAAAAPQSGEPPVLGATQTRQPTPDELATFPRVGFWPRFGASLLDFILVMVAVSLPLGQPEFFPIVWIFYHLGMWAWRGTTLGGIVFSLRIVRLDGRPFDLVTAIVRLIGATLSLFVAGLGFFWASWNPEKQSWHDMIAGTVIVRTPRSMPLV